MNILLGTPHNGSINWHTGRAIWKSSKEHNIQVAQMPSSLLAMGFNCLWAEALNRQEAGDGIDGFAMCHSDLAPDDYWIDTLVRIAAERDADLVSVVNAIKDDRALTSSGLALPGFPWRPWRRFTMRQLAQWPKTFCTDEIHADAGPSEFILLHNTGCWFADLRKPVFHQTNEDGSLKAFFTINDRIVKRSGKWVPEVESEDWFFSRRLHEMGAKTYITREVVTHHYGMCDCDNQTVRGVEDDIDLIRDWSAAEREGPVMPNGAFEGRSVEAAAIDITLADAIVPLVEGTKVVDLGCGAGQYVRHLLRKGILCHGFDGNPDTPTLTGGICDVQDLTVPFDLSPMPDWALSLEVGEHIPAEREDVYWHNVSHNCAKGAILSWAVPGSDGRGHVNCQSPEHVVAKAAEFGLTEDTEATNRLREAATIPYLKQTVHVFRKACAV